ncbi:MAG: hypothetical protein RIC84_25255 [Aggregatilineales bacterium]
MGDKRLYFDEYENKQYYLDENGDRVYVESELPAKKPDSSVKVAVIGGVFAIIVAIIGIIPLFPRETLSGETELVPAFCLILNSQLVNSILNCGYQNRDIEIAVAATLTANAPTPNPVETSVAQTLTAVAEQTLTATALTSLPTDTATPIPTSSASQTATNTPIPIEPFCAFLTLSQISSLQQIQDASDSISQAEAFAGYRQNDYIVGETIPENVVIATDFSPYQPDTTDFNSVGVTPINNNDGYGLFLTNRAIIASYPGTYWCVRDDSSATATPEIRTPTQSTPSISTCRPIDEANNMPSSSEYTLTVEPNQFHIWSSGRITVSYEGEVISSVQDEGYKGFISVFLPVGNEQTIYNITNVNPTYNYHAIYENCSSQQRINETERHARNLTFPGDCGDGCDEVYIRIFTGSSLEEELFSP